MNQNNHSDFATSPFSNKFGITTYPHKLPDSFIIKFNDEYLINNKVKKIDGIGSINCFCTAQLQKLFQSYNILTSYLDSHSEKELVYKNFQKIPIVVRVLNFSDKNLAKVFESSPNEKLLTPIFEFYFNDNRKISLNEYHLLAFGVLSIEDSRQIIKIASKINAILKSFFDRRGYDLVEIPLEFGKINNQIVHTSIFTADSIKIKPKNDNNLSFDFSLTRPTKIKEVFLNFQKLIY